MGSIIAVVAATSLAPETVIALLAVLHLLQFAIMFGGGSHRRTDYTKDAMRSIFLDDIGKK